MVKDLINQLNIVKVIKKGDIVLSHGEETNFYIDIKKAYGYPSARKLICDYLCESLDKRVNCVAGSGHGGISPASIIADRLGIHLTLIRKQTKGYGLDSIIDGYVPTPSDFVSIIDDVFTTGGTLRGIIEVLEPTGTDILDCLVIVKRGEGELNIPLKYLIKGTDLT
ncbi:MAG: hypothetical protein ABIA78_02575 [archaeon]